MGKRTPAPEFIRGAESHPVMLADGTSAQVAHQLKRGIGQCFWYYLQWPCGGWREFDIRSLFPEEREAEIEKQLYAVMLHPAPAVRRTILDEVAQLLASFRFEEIKSVSPLWSNQ